MSPAYTELLASASVRGQNGVDLLPITSHEAVSAGQGMMYQDRFTVHSLWSFQPRVPAEISFIPTEGTLANENQ